MHDRDGWTKYFLQAIEQKTGYIRSSYTFKNFFSHQLAIICTKVDISSSLEFRDGWTLLHFSKYVVCHFQNQVNYF